MTDDGDAAEFEHLPGGDRPRCRPASAYRCLGRPDREFPDHVEETTTPGMRRSSLSERMAAYAEGSERLDRPSRHEENGFDQSVHNIPRRAE